MIKLDIDAIKVESDLLASEFHRGRAGAALRSILELATEFGVDVIAKGVETIDQHERLVSAGCLFGQGWLYSAPHAAEAIDSTLASTVQRRWSEVACSNRPLAVAMAISSQLCALKPALLASPVLDDRHSTRLVETVARSRSCLVSRQPMTGVAETQDVGHELNSDV